MQFYARGLPITILRPSIIYGPNGTAWTVHLAQCLLSGHWGVFDEHAEGICNLVYVDDLVRAVFRVLNCPQAVGEAFNINGPDRLTWNEYFRLFNAVLGRPPLRNLSGLRLRLHSRMMDCARQVKDVVVDRFHDPIMKIYLRGGLLGQWMRRAKTILNTTPSTDRLEGIYSRRAHYADDKARHVLGYRAQVPLNVGLRYCVQWLVHDGFVPPTPDLQASAEPAMPTCEPVN
jgi:nucleoside-diphosphate-sugar epimerase